MVSPRILRELSWCSAKLAEVAICLERVMGGLTAGSEPHRMTAPMTVGQEPESTRLGAPQEGPQALSLPFREEYSDEDLSAEASGSAGA